MTNLFFYGSLRDERLLRIVLGDDEASIELRVAALNDHVVIWAKDRPFPMISKLSGSQATGLLALALTKDQVDRINFYEGGFSYDLGKNTASTDIGDIECEVYYPQEGLFERGEPWLLEDWQRDWGELSRIAAVEAMTYFGEITADELAQRFPRLRARADTRLRAQATIGPTELRSGMAADQVTKEHVKRSHSGFYALDVIQLRHQKFDGTTSETLCREVFVNSDATIVLPYDPVSDNILLVEQFRMGPTGRGDPVPWCLEPVAGMIDPGEDPETTAYRETKEEAGLDLQKLEFVYKGYSSPGASSEYFFLYVGLCKLPETPNSVTGLEDEGEDIRSHILSFDEAMTHVDSGEINVLPTILCLNWLARHRDRLRAGS